MDKFKNKYRIKSARLQSWDYSDDGCYFITICTKNMEYFFGEINNKKMILNNLGKLVAEEWQKIAKIRKHIKLDEWVIMPNHIHGILRVDDSCRDVLTKRLYKGKYPQMSKISPTKKSISTAIRFFKRQITVLSKEICPSFSWQPRFYDHIIKDELSLNNIRQYIIDNPSKWKADKNNVEDKYHWKKP